LHLEIRTSRTSLHRIWDGPSKPPESRSISPLCSSTTTSFAQWKEGSSEPVKMAGMGLKPRRDMQAVSGRLRFFPAAY
jgi:hypothetical protein